ncbi:tRNA-aminoacylation cofactor arc1 [Physcomitrium patens]|uniref:tRNA-binding domain-containing protein n=1 Tax=Physcomitrium patens TaxID=3218 RepID=A9SCW0_PHYPA|nr:aminoacyl tRNA synthase complex-interacting multifunctional protein 1-like [Physcomitrium patens]PNR39900.1 hypothetical protein PHYPA_020180 [Physcomitrium patens]|eukprot:XP_024396417.1 aminoacyl tRNA synthase complex-interacting multifunctional protein 1-like [Physcomitrella patens]
MASSDCSQKAADLVGIFCSKLGKNAGAVDGVSGIGGVCRAVATSAGAVKLLGTTEDVKSEVEKWLELADEVCKATDVNAKLQELNAHLETRSVFAGRGMAITVADLSMFAAVHEILDEKKYGDLEKVPHLLRWIDYIQGKQAVYPQVPVSLPAFNPPKPAPRAAKPVKEDGAGGAKSGNAAADGKIKEEKKKKEKAPAVKKESDTSFSVLDIRVGVINKVWKHPGADALYVEEIDIGEANPRQIVSGLAKFLTEEQMLNRKVIVLTNVKAGKVRDVLSSGLVLCASNSDHTQCEPVVPPSDAKIGEKVTVAGFEGAPEEVLNPKKKQFEKIQPDLKTDATGVACYQGVPFMLSGKPCTSSIVNAIVK